MIELRNAVNDASAVRDALKKKNVHVVYAENCRAKELKAKFKTFLKLIQKGDIAIVFFAGHGVAYNNCNRLLAISEDGEMNYRRDSLNALLLIQKLVTRCDAHSHWSSLQSQ